MAWLSWMAMPRSPGRGVCEDRRASRRGAAWRSQKRGSHVHVLTVRNRTEAWSSRSYYAFVGGHGMCGAMSAAISKETAVRPVNWRIQSRTSLTILVATALLAACAASPGMYFDNKAVVSAIGPEVVPKVTPDRKSVV